MNSRIMLNGSSLSGSVVSPGISVPPNITAITELDVLAA
ncbi:hypothetical protein [Pedobacter sp. ASV28]